MASESEVLAQMRGKIEEIYLPRVLAHLKALRAGDTPPNLGLDELWEFITKKLHPKVESNGEIARLWKSNLKNGTNEFFSFEKFKEPDTPAALYSYLLLASVELTTQIETINEQERETKEQAVPNEGIASATVTTPTPGTREIVRSQEIELAQREAQKENLSNAKNAFLRERLIKINDLLPVGRKLSDLEIQNILRVGSLNLTTLTTEQLFIQFGLTQSIKDPQALFILKECVDYVRASDDQTHVFSASDKKVEVQLQQKVLELGVALGDAPVRTGFGKSGKVIAELAKTGDTDAVVARSLREQTLKSVWNPDQGAKGLVKRVTGQTTKNQVELLKSLGVFEEGKPHPTEEEFIKRVDDYSLLELLGVSKPKEGKEEQATARVTRPDEQLKIVTHTAENIVTHPSTWIGGRALAHEERMSTVIGSGVTAASFGLMGATIGATAGPVISWLGLIGGAAIGGAGSNLFHIGENTIAQNIGQPITRALGVVPNIPIGSIASSIGGSTLSGAAGTAGPLTQHGISQAGKTAVKAAKGISKFLSTLSTISSVFSAGGPVALIVVGSFAVAGIIVLLVIFPGMLSNFEIPGEGLGGGAGEISQFLTLTKTADIDQAAHPLTVQYTITLQAKEGYTVTVKDVTDTSIFNSKGKPSPEPKALHDPQGEIEASGVKGKVLTPTDPIKIVYNVPYNSTYEDTRITNTALVSFDVSGAVSRPNESFSVSNSVSFGNPPLSTGCFEFAPPSTITCLGVTINTKEWTEKEKSLISQAYSVMGPYDRYNSLLCGGNKKVVLYRGPASTYGGCTFSKGIVMYDLGLGSVINTRYTLIHETGHVIGHGIIFLDFKKNVYANNENFVWTYPYGKTDREDFAETVTDYIVYKARKFCVRSSPLEKCTWTRLDLETEYPDHFSWVKNNVFGGISPP